MSARKVAYLTPLYFDQNSYVGGGERYPTNLARGVVEGSRGRYEVELISYGEVAATRPLAPGVTLRILPVARRPGNPLDAVSWDLPAAIASASLVHVHTAFTRASEIGLLVARQQGKPICLSDHGGGSSELGSSLGSLELADRIVCYSDFGATQIRTNVPKVVIKGGVDASWFMPLRDRPQRDRALYVGRLLPHKGIDRLIEALPQELPLTICGRPYLPDYYQRLQAMSESKTVEFVTDADDRTIRDLYNRAWANVLPSVYRDCYGQTYRAPELMGLTLLEAMSCGTPAVASRVAAMPEFIRHGETGFLFDTLPELTEILLQLSEDATLVDRMGQAGRAAVLRDYDLKVSGARLAALYDTLIAEAREEAA